MVLLPGYSLWSDDARMGAERARKPELETVCPPALWNQPRRRNTGYKVVSIALPPYGRC